MLWKLGIQPWKDPKGPLTDWGKQKCCGRVTIWHSLSPIASKQFRVYYDGWEEVFSCLKHCDLCVAEFCCWPNQGKLSSIRFSEFIFLLGNSHGGQGTWFITTPAQISKHTPICWLRIRVEGLFQCFCYTLLPRNQGPWPCSGLFNKNLNFKANFQNLFARAKLFFQWPYVRGPLGVSFFRTLSTALEHFNQWFGNIGFSNELDAERGCTAEFGT